MVVSAALNRSANWWAVCGEDREIVRFLSRGEFALVACATLFRSGMMIGERDVLVGMLSGLSDFSCGRGLGCLRGLDAGLAFRRALGSSGPAGEIYFLCSSGAFGDVMGRARGIMHIATPVSRMSLRGDCTAVLRSSVPTGLVLGRVMPRCWQS